MILAFSFLMEAYGGRNQNLAAILTAVPASIILGIVLGVLAGFLLCSIFSRYTLRSPKKILTVLGTAIIMTWLHCRPFAL